MSKNFIVDTNVLLHDPQAIFHLGDNTVIIPIEVLEELDGFKHDSSELGRNARQVAHLLDELRAKGRLGEGVRLGNGGMLRVVSGHGGDAPPGGGRERDRAARHILALAMFLRHQHPNEETVLITKNVNLRLKADALGIPAQDYTVDRYPDADRYPGWRTLEVDARVVAKMRDGVKVRIEGIDGPPNEYVFLQEPGTKKGAQFGRFAANGLDIQPLPRHNEYIIGIKPLNLEQIFAMDALLDDNIQLITLTGKAGTGKTLLAVAAGLHKVFAEDRFHRLLVFRPTMPFTRDIGYLPGDIKDKMQPWMQPVYDALELLREQDKRSPSRALPPDVLDCDEISIEPLTYIRGRSIPHQYIIIDEAQNLTPLEVKTIITRVGQGTKIILTGDPHQIDNPYVDSLSNGLAFLVERFRFSELAAHICLVKGERSQLAETAANLL